MRAIGSWRLSTWLIVLWSAFCVWLAVSLTWVMLTSCTGKTDTGTPTCQDWANLWYGTILIFLVVLWLVVLTVLSAIWAWKRPKEWQVDPSQRKPPGGTPSGVCAACGARVADRREVCPRCGHSPQAGYDGWLSTDTERSDGAS